MISRAALTTLVAVAGIAAPQPQVFRSRTDAVTVNVSVRDGNRAVSGLGIDDFELRDNGVVQDVSDLTTERLPLDLTVSIDLSGSVSARQLDQLRRALRDVSDSLQPRDSCTVAAFTRRIVETNTSRARFCEAILEQPETRTTADTALFDAALVTLVHATTSDRRAVGILLTDGLENVSFFDAATLLDAATHTDLVLHVIASPGSSLKPSESANWRALTSVARSTGGRVIMLREGANVGSAFLRALEEFRSSYVLRYVPTGVTTAGWHELTVKVVRPGASRYTVTARAGYVGG